MSAEYRRTPLSVLVMFLLTVAPAHSPELFAPGVISTGHEFSVTFSPDGREVYFTRYTASTQSTHVMRSTLVDGVWQTPQPEDFSSDAWSDLDPALSPDGRRLYFVSTRRRPSRDAAVTSTTPEMDIWFVEREGSGWSTPRWIAELSSDAKEGSPTIDRNGTICFFSSRENSSGNNAIYCAAPTGSGWAKPVRLNANINAGPSDTSPFLSSDGNTMLFYSTRDGGMGKADLYISRRVRGEWQPAVNLGNVVNGPESEVNPSVSPNGMSLFFGRRGALYSVPLAELSESVISPSFFK